MAATMIALDSQVRGASTAGLVPGSRDADEVAKLAAWVGSYYGRPVAAESFEQVGAEIAGWYATDLTSTTPVVVDSRVWPAIDRMTRSSGYLYGVGVREDPALPAEPRFSDPGVTVIVDGGAPIAASFQDVTPGAAAERVAAVTAVCDGRQWSVTEWSDVEQALSQFDTSGFGEMAKAAEQMAPWSIGGSYLVSSSGTGAHFAAQRIKNSQVNLATEGPAPKVTAVAVLAALSDAVSFGMVEVIDRGVYLEVLPPAGALDTSDDRR
jgi:hypothetical protein